MSVWRKRVDDLGASPRPPYPVEAFKDFYVAPIGGFSGELEPGVIGIHEQAFDANVRIKPYEDLVTVAKLRGWRRMPLTLSALFCIVPLDRSRPDALAKSPQGEAVLGPMEDAAPERRELALAVGDEIVMNGTIARLGHTRASVWDGARP